MGSGTVSCAVKEGVKLYFYSIRAGHVERARNIAIEKALHDAVSQGMAAKEAATLAQKEGAKAAKMATRKAKRIIGPIISSGWDFFEALYFGGTITEGFLRGSGTLFGAYGGGYLGEQKLGRVGYLVGSHLGSWVGGRIGLMVYDVVNGVEQFFQFLQFLQGGETEIGKHQGHEQSEDSGDSYADATYSYGDTPAADESSESADNSDSYEALPYESSETQEASGFW